MYSEKDYLQVTRILNNYIYCRTLCDTLHKTKSNQVSINMLLNIFCRFLFLLLINWQISTTEAQFRLYHSDRVSGSELYHDCLLYYESDKAPPHLFLQRINSSHQIIPFCIRLLDLHSNPFVNNETRVNHGISREFETIEK